MDLHYGIPRIIVRPDCLLGLFENTARCSLYPDMAVSHTCSLSSHEGIFSSLLLVSCLGIHIQLLDCPIGQNTE